MSAEPLPLFSMDAVTPTTPATVRRRRSPAAPVQEAAPPTKQVVDAARAAPVEATQPGPPVADERTDRASGLAPDVDSRDGLPRLLLTTTEAARCLGIGRSKLYQLIQAGAVESVLIGASRRVPADAVSTYVESLRHPQRRETHRFRPPTG